MNGIKKVNIKVKGKNLLKAIGFLALITLVYLGINFAVAFVILVIMFITKPEMLQQAGVENFEWMLTSEMLKYSLHITILSNIITLLIIALFFLARKDKFIKYVKFKRFRLIDGTLVVGFGMFLNLLMLTILSFVSELEVFSKPMNRYDKLMEETFNGPFIIILIAVIIAAPLFEEIVVRGIVFNDFKKALPVWMAIIIQALIFGLMHMNLIQGSYATLLGIILGLIYYYYKSIWIPILMHFSFNLTSIMFEEIFGSDVSLSLVGIIGLIGSIIIVGIMIKIYDKQYYIEDEEPIEEEDETVFVARTYKIGDNVVKKIEQ
jgi:hypothetical protein